MANALLFYRTPTSDQTITPNPEDLPAAQKLLFTPPNDLVNGIEETWNNNIVKKVPPKPSGRKLIQTDEGFSGWQLIISGNYIVDSGDSATKLHDFRKLAQADSFHVLGVFGILYPNGPSYLNIDPDDTLGLMIQDTRGKHIGVTREIFDFSVSLSFGGTA